MELLYNYIEHFFIAFGQLSLDMAPWLVLGFVFAGLFKVWFPDRWADEYLSKPNFSSVIWASILGVPLPLCSCGVLPMAVSLHKKGASKGAINSFLISTPQTGVDSILATYSLLGLPFAIARPLIAFISGIFGGAVMNLFSKGEKNNDTHNDVSCKNEFGSQSEHKNVWIAIRYGFTDLFKEMYRWLLVGLAIAALLNLLLPDDLSTLFNQYPGADMAIALLISVPMYICATGSIPIALVLLLKGFSPGAAIVLLMAGPATNIAGIVLLSRSISSRFAIIYVATIMVASLFFGFLANLLFTTEAFLNTFHYEIGHVHGESSASLIQFLSLMILLALVLYFVYLDASQIVASRFRRNREMVTTKYRFRLFDVTCKNCAKKIDARMWKEKQIVSVNLLFEERILEVETSLSPTSIIEMLKALGYGSELIKESPKTAGGRSFTYVKL